MTCWRFWLWFFLSIKLYNSQFNNSTNIGKAGQAWRRKGRNISNTGCLSWTGTTVRICLRFQGTCLKSLLLRLREKPLQHAWKGDEGLSRFGKKTRKQGKQVTLTVERCRIVTFLSFQPFCMVFLHAPLLSVLAISSVYSGGNEDVRCSHRFLSFFFFFFPVNVENFREALHIALPDVGWVGSSQDLRTVRRDHRTTQMYPMSLCHVLYADRREKLIKKMPKLRSCLYREIFSFLISAWDMQSNWNKEGENLAQHFHFVFPTFPFNSSGKSGFWITEPSELLLFSEKLRFSVIICAVWITNDWHIHERCCIDRKWSTAL